MKAALGQDGHVTLTMTLEEAVILHERIALAEWAEDLAIIELPDTVEKMVVSDIQQTLAPLIPGLGTDAYGVTLRSSYEEIRSAEAREQRH